MNKKLTPIIAALAIFTGCATQLAKNKNGFDLIAKDGYGTNLVEMTIGFSTNGYPTNMHLTMTDVAHFRLLDDSKLTAKGLFSATAFTNLHYNADSLFTGRSTQAGVASFATDVSTNAAPVIESGGGAVGEIINNAIGNPLP